MTYSMATTWGGKKLHAIKSLGKSESERYPSDARTLCGMEFWTHYDTLINNPDLLSWSIPESLTCKKCIAILQKKLGESERLCDMEQIVFRTGSRCIKPFAHPGACDYRGKDHV